jgi:hypothetical protein
MSRAARLAVALAALALAGCAGDDGDSSSTAEWAGSFCTAAATWTDEVDQITSTVSASPTVESLRGAVDDLKAATDELVGEVRGLGAPDVEGAEEIEAAIDAFTETAEAKNEAVDEAVQDATTESVAQALAALGELTSAFQTMLQAFEDADAGGELETAFEDAPACNQLTRN